jgi:hypothetical protein
LNQRAQGPVSDAPLPTTAGGAAFEVRYVRLNGGAGLAFPCDATGRVDVDRLSDRARANYLLARKLVGRDYGAPVVCEAPLDAL